MEAEDQKKNAKNEVIFKATAIVTYKLWIGEPDQNFHMLNNL